MRLRRTCGVEHVRTYDLGQAAMVALDLVGNMLSFDERRTEQYEGIRRTRDMRSIFAFIFGICTDWAERGRTRRRHDEHGRRRRGSSRQRKYRFIVGLWARFCSEREAHTRDWVVYQRRHIIWTNRARDTRSAQLKRTLKCKDLPSISSCRTNSRPDMMQETAGVFSYTRWGTRREGDEAATLPTIVCSTKGKRQPGMATGTLTGLDPRIGGRLGCKASGETGYLRAGRRAHWGRDVG